MPSECIRTNELEDICEDNDYFGYAEFGDELALEHHEHPPKSTAGVQGSSMAIFVSKVWKSRKAGRIVGMMGDKTSMYPVTPSIGEAFTNVKEFNFETPSPDAVNIAAQERESPKNVGCVTKNMKNMAPISNTLEGSIS
mmetsp:Transcript_1266/g.2309  ORF Transcript_1266/g.2309 Transcript_1266/m.2309 type:complete len:139 (+) Transcript_1266:75-491(+)